MGSHSSKDTGPECKNCKDYRCAASEFTPAASPNGDEVVFMLPNNVFPPPSTQAWKNMKVCTQEDGTEGVVDFYGAAGNPKGCVTANAMCCGGKETQCMVNQADESKSQVGSITVPCGVNVKYSYDGACDFDEAPSYELVGNGVPRVLVPDKNTGTEYPFSFQFSLAPGYKCDKGSIVMDGTGAKPCDQSETPSFGSQDEGGGGVAGLSKRDVLIFAAVAGAVVLSLVYVLTHRKANDFLSVQQIVRRAGVNEHLVIPGGGGATAGAAPRQVQRPP